MGELPQKHRPNTPATPSIRVLDYCSMAQRPPGMLRSNQPAFWAAGISGLILIVVLFWTCTPTTSHAPPELSDILVLLIPSLPALCFGVVGLRRARREQLRGTGAAVFGIIIAILALMLSALATYSKVDSYYRYGRGGYTCYKVCQWNLESIGTAAQSHLLGTGRYPTLAELLTDQRLATTKLVCPASGDGPASGETVQEQLADLAAPGRCSYIYLGPGLDPKKATPKTILAYENLDHHESGMNVLYADGTVEWVRLKRAKQILAELKAGRNPPNLPQ